MASGHLTHPSWDSDSKRGTTDGTMRNKYDQARAQDMPIIERVHGLAERLGESDIAYLEEPYTAHELVGPLARPGERALAGTLAPTLKEKAK